MADAERGANARIEIDLASQTITLSDGQKIGFDVDPWRKHCLLNGLDDIGADAREGRGDRCVRDVCRSRSPLGLTSAA